jgi:hypothetical protein
MAKRSDSTFISSHDTQDAAWAAAHKYAKTLKGRGLAKEMGVSVEKVRGAYWVVLIKRK